MVRKGGKSMDENIFPNQIGRKGEFTCSLGFAMTVIGSKWRAIILWHIITESTIRYGKLKSMVPGISHKVFTKELKSLEADHLIERKAYPVVPPMVEYSITDLGLSLKPALSDLCNWGKIYIDQL